MASEKVTSILEEIKGLSVIELFDLEKAIEEEFGVSAAAVAVSAGAGAGAGAAAAEQTEFTVMLKSFGDSKMGVIKAVKDVLGMGLKEQVILDHFRIDFQRVVLNKATLFLYCFFTRNQITVLLSFNYENR